MKKLYRRNFIDSIAETKKKLLPRNYSSSETYSVNVMVGVGISHFSPLLLLFEIRLISVGKYGECVAPSR